MRDGNLLIANPLGIRNVDYVELFVGNASVAAHYFGAAFGFELLAYAGPETKRPDGTSLVLGQGRMRLLVTSGVDPEGPVALHARLHGDGVRDIAFCVENTAVAFERAIRAGAQAVREPTVLEDEHGSVTVASVSTFGDTRHSFVQRDGYSGIFLPGYVTRRAAGRKGAQWFTTFDHFAVALPTGTLDSWVAFYRRVFGFEEVFEQEVDTGTSGMRSKVVRGASDDIVFPLLMPTDGPRRSQVQEFLHFNHGPGVQHAALRTEDIMSAVRALSQEGVEFVRAPDAYYGALSARVGALDRSPETYRESRVMVDRDDDGYLLQVFTKPVTSRPTFFIEVIQRQGSQGFGGGNIRALFEAVEQEQVARECAAAAAPASVGVPMPLGADAAGPEVLPARSRSLNQDDGTTWLDHIGTTARGGVRLICFPHAGGSPLSFRPWRRLLPDWVELYSAHLPGRGRRFGEPLFTDFARMLPILAEALRPALIPPYMLFGHSLGALLAFEVARIAEKRGWGAPSVVAVAAHRAPHLTPLLPPRSKLPDVEFIDELRRLNGTSDAILEHPEMRQLIATILRADFRLCESYGFVDGGRVACPLIAIGGSHDPNVSESDLAAWERHTSGRFVARIYPGDHFFLHEHTGVPAFLAEQLGAIVHGRWPEFASSTAPGTREAVFTRWSEHM